MHKFLITLAIALLGAIFSTAHAADDTLYRALGEKAGIAGLMTDFVGRLKVDPRIGRYFKETKPAALAESLTDQVCKTTGGSCEYEGAPMNKAHQDLEIGRADFNALVEVLQDSMEAKGVPFADQRRLLALLAPMHRDIVTR
jgi:hemoglobin